MRQTTIVANTLDEAWYLTIKGLFNKDAKGIHSYTIQKGSYEGQDRIEYDYLSLTILYPEQRPLAPVVPEGIPPPASEDAINKYFNRYLLSDIKEDKEQYTYGERILISMKKVIEMIKNSPMTNQAILQIASPEDIDLDDPPCLRSCDLRVSMDGYLHMFPYFRSWAIWGGLPINLAGLQLLKEYMCREASLKPGITLATSKGAHLYDQELEIAKTRLGMKEWKYGNKSCT